MTTSSSTDWALTAEQVVRLALLKLRVIDEQNQTIRNEVLTNSLHNLNAMLKSWQMRGVDVWLNQEIVVFMDYNAQYYLLGPTGDQAAEITDHAATTLASDAAASALSLTVSSSTGIAVSDNIGVCTDDGTIHWDTVLDVSGTTVSISSGLDSAATSGSYLFAYTSAITRPIEITEARVRNTDDTDQPIEVIKSRNEFMAIDDKTSQGETLKVYYDPLTTNGKLFVWPVCGTSNIEDRLILSCRRSIHDMDAGKNTFDAPPEVTQAIIWNLADELQPDYGMKNGLITSKAAYYFAMLKQTYKQKDNIFLRPRT